VSLGEPRLSDGPTGVRGLTFTGGRPVALSVLGPTPARGLGDVRATLDVPVR